MIVQCDAKQLEWRTAVFLSQDKVGLEEILNGDDLHALNQERFKLGAGDAGRLRAKTFLFRLIYGGQAFSYANDPNFTDFSKSEKFWQGVIDATYEKYTGLAQWHKKLVQTAIETGKVVIPSGREYHYADPANPRERPKILNYPVNLAASC